MPKTVGYVVLALMSSCVAASHRKPSACGTPPSADLSPGAISLSDRLAAGQLRTVNRAATALDDGNAVRATGAPGIGLTWIDGTEFVSGTIDADVCGRDVQSESFVGIASTGRTTRNTRRCF